LRRWSKASPNALNHTGECGTAYGVQIEWQGGIRHSSGWSLGLSSDFDFTKLYP